jgi:hypothetical protein
VGAAQDQYQMMLRELVAPVLRADGLKGSGQRYVLNLAQHVGRVTFERSVYQSDSERLSFRVWLSAEPREHAMRPRTGGRPLRSQRPETWGAALADLIVPSRPGMAWWLLRTDPSLPEDPPTKRVRGQPVPGGHGRIWGQGAYDTLDRASIAADVIAGLERWGLPALRRELARMEKRPESSA